MARDRKRFNYKARQGVRYEKKNGEEQGQQVAVDPSLLDSGKYDESNPLLLAQKKDKKKGKLVDTNRQKKFLSKKQRKKLQAIVDRRSKKSDRAGVLEELSKYQLSQTTLSSLTPLVQIQTEGVKKLLAARKKEDEMEMELDNLELDSQIVSVIVDKGKGVRRVTTKGSLKGASKKRFGSWSTRWNKEQGDKTKNDPKVLGFDEESESESDEEPGTEGDDDVDAPKIKEEAPVPEMKMEVEEIEIIEETKCQVPVKATKKSTKASKKSTKASKKSFVFSKTSEKPEKPELELVGVRVVSREKKTFIPVNRTPEIETVRCKLPIIAEEQVIMESVTENSVTVLAGETGSGKTTQVPQFLYEAGYAQNGKIIGITEPRRVAAISMSQRVATELNLPPSVVSYQIRFEGNAGAQTRIKFMTDGVLLKEMERDFLLSRYSAICVDEAHERSLYTDILIGLLSRAVRLREKRGEPLKLIIMSATMRVEDFVENSRLFKVPPPLIHVPTRQFPVSVHFAKVTPENYLLAAFKKAVAVHKKLPPGGILIFVTGQAEVKALVKKLKEKFPRTEEASEVEEVGRKKSRKRPEVGKGKKPKQKPKSSPSLRSFDLSTLNLNKSLPLQASEEISDGSDYDSENDSENDDMLGDADANVPDHDATPLHVLPLYSMLPSVEQQAVFAPPPPGARLCVVSTNVAETSLTIPSVRYVIDSGKVKAKVWDKLTGVGTFVIGWESKASAEQRSGRAGRTGPGHVYRLYSSAVFDSDFPQYTEPEIRVRPVDDMLLLMKSMGIDKVAKFPFPSSPSSDQLLAGERTLLALGAINEKTKEINELGRSMAHFPLGPRYAKMLALSYAQGLIQYTIALVAALTVQEVFLDASLPSEDPADSSSKDMRRHWAIQRRKWAGSGPSFLLGDAMVLLRAVGAFEFAEGSPQFAASNGLRLKALGEIRKLRKQLVGEVNLVVDDGVPLDPKMAPPSDEEATLLRQLLLAGLPDRVGRRISDEELGERDPKLYKNAYKCGELEEPVFINKSSALAPSKSFTAQWVVYQELFEVGGKLSLRGVSAIEPEWIPIYAKQLCAFGPPLTSPPPYYDAEKGTVMAWVKATYGKQGWELPTVSIEYPESLEKFKLFAQFFVSGSVTPALSPFVPSLLSLPATMTKSWAKLQPRTTALLSALTSSGVCSHSALVAAWRQQGGDWLLKEYLDWLPFESHPKVMEVWPGRQI